MSRAVIAAALAVAAMWLFRRRPTSDVADQGLWSAFDRGEDPTAE